MKQLFALSAILMAAFGLASGDKTWSVKADYIEACSCNMFCMCYFNTHPDGDLCEFNNAVRIREGHVGDVKVNGAKFWLSGNLGGDFTKPLDTAILTYDPSLSKEQRDAVKFLVGKIYPFKFTNFVEDEAPITWKRDGMDGHAKLGDKAEVSLTGIKDTAGKQTTIRNLNYWGAQKNNGFELAYGTHRYKGNGRDYNYDKKNGFFITIESSGMVDTATSN
ncbi:MAG: DUF1326 domain-containing protein [Fimbriimonas sp.]